MDPGDMETQATSRQKHFNTEVKGHCPYFTRRPYKILRKGDNTDTGNGLERKSK